MKIAHISDCYLPRLGGIECQVAGLSAVQSEHGHDVVVLTATPAHDRPGEVAPRVSRMVTPLPFELPVHLGARRHLAAMLEQEQPDVVHVHAGAVSPFAWAGAHAAVRQGLPTVVTVHSMWDPLTRTAYRGLHALSRWRTWPLVVTTVSRAAAATIRPAAAGTEVHVIPNGIDLAGWLAPAGVRLEGAPGHRVDGLVHVVAVGRLAPRKHPLTLLRVLDAAHRRVGTGAGLHATIVGDGPARPAMERMMARRAMAGWLTLAGRLDQHAIRRTLAGADLFVAPAVLESFGLAALEARTAGLPVIARTGNGIADFVADGRNGLLADSVPALVDALVQLTGDRGLRATIAEHNATTPPRQCGWPAVTEAFERCYDRARLVQSRASPS